MIPTPRLARARLSGALLALVCAATAAAQPFPNRAITLIVPFAPGGTAEIIGRAMAQEMQKPLGAPMIVELKPGAGGIVGSEFVAKQARPDGYTMLLGSASLASNVSLMKMSFDPRKDLAPVAGVGMVPNILVVGHDAPFKTLAEVINAGKANPGKLTFGSSGPGTSSHLSGELFKATTGVDLLHVPYKGSGQVYPDLISGRVDMLFDLQGSALGQIKGGKVRPLATTAARRSKALPAVPTIAESGYPGYENGSWIGFFVPAGTPQEAIARLEDATAKALQTEAIQQRFEQMATDPIPVATADFGRYFQSDVRRWEKLVADGRLQRLQQ
jgi:tripartite-type tricarboxylate transporter receptor subunit TctC